MSHRYTPVEVEFRFSICESTGDTGKQGSLPVSCAVSRDEEPQSSSFDRVHAKHFLHFFEHLCVALFLPAQASKLREK